jgi:hypothetical protein
METMTNEHRKPALFGGSEFEAFKGGEDPAQVSRLAHDTASALLGRVREDPDPAVINRLIGYTDTHGIDAIAELWSRAAAHSLPGALWRIYLLRALIRQNPVESSFLYQKGVDVAVTIDPIVAGATSPTGPEEITELADQILRGIYEGDFAIALERAAAFCRVMSLGAAAEADSSERDSAERATEFTTRANRFQSTAGELTTCSKLWRDNSLD